MYAAPPLGGDIAVPWSAHSSATSRMVQAHAAKTNEMQQEEGEHDDGRGDDDECEVVEEPRVSLREHLAKEWGQTDEDPFELPKEGSWLIVQTLAGGDGSDTYVGLAEAFDAATTNASATDDQHMKALKAQLKDLMERIKAADERLAQLLILAGDVAQRVTAKSSDEWEPYDKVLVEPRIGQEPRPLERATPYAWRDAAVRTGSTTSRMYVLLRCEAGGCVGYDIPIQEWARVAERVEFDEPSQDAPPQPQQQQEATAQPDQVSIHFHGVAVHTCWDTSRPVVSCDARRRARRKLALSNRSNRLRSVTAIATWKRNISKIRRHHARKRRRRTSVSGWAHTTWTRSSKTTRLRSPSSTPRQKRINATQWSRLHEDAIRPMRRVRLASTASRPMR